MLILIIACNSKKSNSMQNNSIDFKFNERVTLIGVYTKSIISKRDKKDHHGHYKIIVNDSLEVNLLPPYLKEALRPKKEVQSFEGEKVVVTGVILKNTAFSEPSLENQPLTVSVPCFITIESIHLAKE
jgi:hypothetical protein